MFNQPTETEAMISLVNNALNQRKNIMKLLTGKKLTPKQEEIVERLENKEEKMLKIIGEKLEEENSN